MKLGGGEINHKIMRVPAKSVPLGLCSDTQLEFLLYLSKTPLCLAHFQNGRRVAMGAWGEISKLCDFIVLSGRE